MHCAQRNRRKPLRCFPKRWQWILQAPQVIVISDFSVLIIASIIQRALAVCQEQNDRIREAVAHLPDWFAASWWSSNTYSLNTHFHSLQRIETTAIVQGIVQRGKAGGKQGEQGKTYSHPFGRGLLLNSSGLLPLDRMRRKARSGVDPSFSSPASQRFHSR